MLKDLFLTLENVGILEPLIIARENFTNLLKDANCGPNKYSRHFRKEYCIFSYRLSFKILT